MNWDGFIDNTKDRWRSDEMICKKELLLDDIGEMKHIDYHINYLYYKNSYLELKYYFKNRN